MNKKKNNNNNNMNRKRNSHQINQGINTLDSNKLNQNLNNNIKNINNNNNFINNNNSKNISVKKSSINTDKINYSVEKNLNKNNILNKNKNNNINNNSSNNEKISKKNSISNFSLHSQLSNRKSTNSINNTNNSQNNITYSEISKSLKNNSNTNLTNLENNINNTVNLHKTKTLQKFSISNPYFKNKNSNKKNLLVQRDKKKINASNSISITNNSIDNSLHLNKTQETISNFRTNLSNNNNNNENNVNNNNYFNNNSTNNNLCSLNSIEEERISPTSFVCLALLGKGSFGEVYLVQKINTQVLYAMKVLNKDRIMGQNLLKYAMAERNVLSLSNHPFIVKLNFAFQTSSKLFLILDYCPNGDLSKHLYIEKRFPEPKAKFYLCEVLLALEDLHKRDIIFRDLKPDNVVLDNEGHIKLTDFGLSKEGVFDSKSAKSFCGSIAYLAPEMLKKQGHGKAVDWYLLGVLFYEMLVGIPPYFTAHKEDIFHNIEYGELQFPKLISNEAKELLRALLQKDPNKRLGGGIRDALDIKEHVYFKDVNWEDVYNKKIKPPEIRNIKKAIKIYNQPRLFANEDDDDDNNSGYYSKNQLMSYQNNNLQGWSFINNEYDDEE
jgi:serine/threonine protein kinase